MSEYWERITVAAEEEANRLAREELEADGNPFRRVPASGSSKTKLNLKLTFDAGFLDAEMQAKYQDIGKRALRHAVMNNKPDIARGVFDDAGIKVIK